MRPNTSSGYINTRRHFIHIGISRCNCDNIWNSYKQTEVTVGLIPDKYLLPPPPPPLLAGVPDVNGCDINMAVFWDVAACSMIQFHRRFQRCFMSSCLMAPIMMETGITPETSLNFNQTTRRNIPECSDIYIRSRETLKYYLVRNR
jgi:hypothetical protein